MLTVSIDGFRCHGSYVISVDEGLTLIRGTSGIGKSTILEAIYWCLYGTLRNIYNPLHPNKKCKVTVECNTITVSRSTKPTNLSVIYKNEVHNEDSQQIIHYVFGSKDIFLSSSYLSQGSRNNWIELTTDDKLGCIESIAYSDCNPDIYHSRAVEYKNKCSKDYDNLEIEYKIQERLFNDRGGYDPSQCLSLGEIGALTSNITELQNDKKNLNVKLTKHRECKNKVEYCNKTLVDMERQLSSIVIRYDQEELDRMQVRLKEQQSILQHNRYAQDSIKRSEDLYKIYKLSDKDGILENSKDPLPSLQDVIKNGIEMTKYLEWERTITQFEDVKNVNIVDLERYVLQYEQNSKNETILNQINSIGEVGDILPNMSYNIGLLKDKITRHKSGKRFTCPECSSELELNGHGLIRVEHVCLEEMEQEYSKLLSTHDKHNKIEALRSKIVPITITLDKNITEVKNQILRYKKYLSLGTQVKPEKIYNFSGTMLSNYVNYKSCTRLECKDSITLDYNQNTIDEAKNLLYKRTHILGTINSTNADILRYQQYIDNTIEPELVSIDEKIMVLTNKYHTAVHANSQKEQYDRLVSIYNTMNELYASKYYIEYIITCISQTEYVLINDTVELFNRTLEDVVSNLFDEPLTLRIMLIKTDKKNKTKAQIHLEIIYKGMDITNVNQLSGGESTRISIALLIAFHVIHPSPFILIDESLSNVNHQLREQCCQVIKKYCHVPCLMILHETSSEGLFDNIVELV